jgi:hypothetical protein
MPTRKHDNASPAGTRIDAENNLPPWEPKSYEKAAKATANSDPASLREPAAPVTMPQALAEDVFWWFDETAPKPGAPLFEVVLTGRAYDGALGMLRQARQGNTGVQSGASILDTDYHPPTVSFSSWRKSNPTSAPSMFYRQGEDVNDVTPVMHFQMTKRAYEQMLALTAGSDLRVRPSQGSN